jgi:hypothetical protein
MYCKIASALHTRLIRLAFHSRPSLVLSELGLKDQALLLDLDLLGVDRILKLLRGTQGDDLLWRGDVAMRALLPIFHSNPPDPRTDWRSAGKLSKRPPVGARRYMI